MVAGRRGLPAVGLLVRRRHGHRGLRVLGAHHAAADDERGERDEARPSQAHGVAPAIRTCVPLVSESDGETMTWSVGCSPERISTLSP